MSGQSPYRRPYYKGYSHEQDRKLAKALFCGTAICDETGRVHFQYLPKDSPEEREGFEALCRLLFYNWGRNDRDIAVALWGSLRPDSGFEARLVFKRKKKGRFDPAADLQIALGVHGLKCADVKTEAAVRQVADKYGLKRTAVFDAMARARRDFPSLFEW